MLNAFRDKLKEKRGAAGTGPPPTASEASSNLRQAVDANTTYEKKLCAQAAELELGAARVAELEKAAARVAELEKAAAGRASLEAENARLRKALEEAERKEASLEGEVASLRQGKEAVEAEVLKTMEDTMVLITPSFDPTVRQAGVLYGGPPPSVEWHMKGVYFSSPPLD
ncbi:hypothetical protein VNO80_19787 [Phaseolus coccineus]|uniref:Uncharacterized protein n=1 Tax=Phaseolus coccineus TaxID=3886 RepID=A0AAN9MH22_PHACN